MTVIVWDGATMAADKCATSGWLKTRVTKIARTFWLDGQPALVGMCGDGAFGLALLAHLQAGAPRPDAEKFDIAKGDTVGMLAKKDGSIYKITTRLELMPYDEPFYAVGSGAECAFGALHMGATARQAVQAAIKYIQGCDGGIDEVMF
jgi:ATP-dependent protease HslVU (ClpYQ) peptidase subunit